MKISLSEKLLNYMIAEYKGNNKLAINFQEFENVFSDIDSKILNEALIELEQDGLVKIQFADNIAYNSFLLNVDRY